MKAKIDSTGILVITPNNITESYALETWLDKNSVSIKHKKISLQLSEHDKALMDRLSKTA